VRHAYWAILLIILMGLFSTLPSSAFGQRPPLQPAQSAIPSSSVEPLKAPQIDYTYTAWFDRRLAVVEASLADSEDSSARLGLELSLIAIGFGGLLTVIIVFFALRTERTAAAAAVEAAHKAIESTKAQIESSLAAAVEIKRQADAVLDKIKAGETEAELHIEKIRAAAHLVGRMPVSAGDEKVELSKEDEIVLIRGADSLKSLPPSTWTYDDFRVLVADAREKQDYDRMINLSLTMKALLKDPKSQAYADNLEGVGLALKNKISEAEKVYTDTYNKYIDSSDQYQKQIAITSRRNLAGVLSGEGRYSEAIELCNDIIVRFGDTTDQDALRIVTNALNTKSYSQNKLEDFDGAEDTLMKLLTLWHRSGEEVRINIAKHIANRSIGIRQNRPESAVKILTSLLDLLATDVKVADKELANVIDQLRQSRDKLSEEGSRS
jgi:tetratricopeptide (TPR) repeat protein